MKKGIYKIICLGNNKFYIGSSKNIEKRISNHIKRLKKNSHINEFLQNAWNKYGENAFLFEVIEECSDELLLKREQFWMDITQCYNRDIGFNACKKADRPTGYKHTEESKLKMSLIKKKQLLNKEIKSNLVRKPKGFKQSQETKDKIRATKVGILNPMFGKKLSKDEKIQKGKFLNSVPRWNKGLTIKDDERIKKLATWKNKLPPNAITHYLIDTESGEEWSAKSLKHLTKICPLSSSTIHRLKTGKCGIKIKNKYKIKW